MKFNVQFLSFYVIQVEGNEGQGAKSYKHYQTLDEEEYEHSEIKKFLDGSLRGQPSARWRKIRNRSRRRPRSGAFFVEPGYDLDSNPNFNQLTRLRAAEDVESFHNFGDDLVRSYLDTSAVRGERLSFPRLSCAPMATTRSCSS